MDGIDVNLEGEEAVFSWKDGKVYCPGYDLESERTVLTLTGLGRGVGVLLVAMNDCCKSEAEFIAEACKFVAGQGRVVSRNDLDWPRGQLIFEYFSYIPDPSIRWGGLEKASLLGRHYDRILKDPNIEIKAWMAGLKELPEKYFYSLASLSILDVNCTLAMNKSCPSDVVEILAGNTLRGVRRCVSFNSKCSVGTLEDLAQNKDVNVRVGVAFNVSCPRELLELLAHDEDPYVRRHAQENLAKSKGVEV